MRYTDKYKNKRDIRPALIKTTDHLVVSCKLNYPNKRGPGFFENE